MGGNKMVLKFVENGINRGREKENLKAKVKFLENLEEKKRQSRGLRNKLIRAMDQIPGKRMKYANLLGEANYNILALGKELSVYEKRLDGIGKLSRKLPKDEVKFAESLESDPSLKELDKYTKSQERKRTLLRLWDEYSSKLLNGKLKTLFYDIERHAVQSDLKIIARIHKENKGPISDLGNQLNDCYREIHEMGKTGYQKRDYINLTGRADGRYK